jgi:hypothetical protein
MKALGLGFAVLLISCGMPSGDQVRGEFLALHPGAVILDAGPGEGDFDHAYWCIRYRQPPDTVLREQYWLYQRGADGFRVIHRDSALAGPKSCASAA